MAHLRVPSVLAVLLGAILPTGVRAQSINGRIVTADSSRGVPGAIVVLTDSVRRESTRTLSRADGRFVLRIAAPGTYGVRVLRIGFRPDDFGPFVIGPSANVPVVLALTQRAVSLMAMNVSDRSECRALDDGGSAPLALWEEARKSLLATVLTRSTLAPILTMASFERVVDAKSQRQLALRVRRQTGASTRPYVSPLSPDEYAARGYVEADDGSVVFRAPDADVLLSESFLVSHCARIVASPRDTSIIGLGFRPTRTERGRVDVEAVLWLARSPVELRSIDVSYVGVSDAVREAGAGASLILNRIPDGGLIVSSWVIRAPRVITVKGFQASVRSLSGRAVSRDSIADVWNIGGAVMRARVGETEVWRGPAARLEGHVREDETGRPVAGVGLVLVGTNYAATADSTGAFSIADVLPGEYELVARSPQLEALGLDVPTTARLQLGDSTSTADIRMPAVRKALARVCAMSDTLGAVQGRVEDAEHRGVGDARVVAGWLTTARVVTGVGVLGQGPTLSILTDADGRFRLCGLPRYHDVVLSAARENLVASPQTIRIEPGQDLAVVTLTTHRSMHLATADGLGAVDGVVRDESGTLGNVPPAYEACGVVGSADPGECGVWSSHHARRGDGACPGAFRDYGVGARERGPRRLCQAQGGRARELHYGGADRCTQRSHDRAVARDLARRRRVRGQVRVGRLHQRRSRRDHAPGYSVQGGCGVRGRHRSPGVVQRGADKPARPEGCGALPWSGHDTAGTALDAHSVRYVGVLAEVTRSREGRASRDSG